MRSGGRARRGALPAAGRGRRDVSPGNMDEKGKTPRGLVGEEGVPRRGACDCQHCVGLARFCEDPTATERRFTAVESIRKHLTKVVKENSLDISLRTLKDKRPYTLVCKKNRASHERRLELHEENSAEMKRLLAATPTSAGELGERLRKAPGKNPRAGSGDD